MNKFKEEPKWVDCYNQPPCTTKWMVLGPNKILKVKEQVSKKAGLRQNDTK